MITLTPPTRRGRVSSGWGASRAYRGAGEWHEGLDFPGDVGEPVLAAAPGLVAHVDNADDSFAGLHVAVRHDGGLVTRYLHNRKNLVAVGQRVERGQVLAELGRTRGTPTGTSSPHVHFDLKADKAAVAEYVARFGMPKTGLGKSTSLGVGVPAEALMADASYAPAALAASLARGVKVYNRPLALYVAIAAVGGYALYRALA